MLRLGLLAILTVKLLLNMTKNTITTEQLFEMIAPMLALLKIKIFIRNSNQ